MDGDDRLGVDIFNVFGGIGNFGPGGRDWYTEDFGMFERGSVERVTGVGKGIIYDHAKIVARDLAFNNRGVGLAKELDFKAADLTRFARTDDNGATDKGRGIRGGKNRSCGVAG